MPKRNTGNQGEQGLPADSGSDQPSLNMGKSPGTARARGSAANLSREARIKGGQRSAQVQIRDEHGQFAGRDANRQQRRANENNQGRNPPSR